MMNVDSHFIIGSSHLYCEDYCLSKTIDDVGILAISDGCSGSGGNVSLGARLICSAFAKVAQRHIEYLKECFNSSSENHLHENMQRVFCGRLLPDFIFEIESYKSCLNLDYADFDCTLIGIIAYKHTISYICIGDGAFHLTFRNKNERMTVFEYTNSMPLYISYLLSPKLLEKYIEYQKQTNSGLVKTTFAIDGDNVNSDIDNAIPFPPLSSIEREVFGFFENIDHAYFFSDGLGSFFKKEDNSSISALEISRSIIKPSNKKDSFVKRSVNFLSKKTWKKDVGHFDDLSVVAVKFS